MPIALPFGIGLGPHELLAHELRASGRITRPANVSPPLHLPRHEGVGSRSASCA